jgi:hypothetical protein
MSTQVQIRRGNTAQTAAFTGSIAELTVDTDKRVVVVHDGTTAGGNPLIKANASITTGQILTSNGSHLLALSNTGTAGTYGNASFIPVVTTDAYGRVSSVTNTAIAISSGVVTGVMTFAQGGANATSYTTGGLLTSNGTAFVSVANTGTAGTYGNAAYHPVITTDAYGRVSGVTNTLVQIAASQVTSGVLPFAQGGSNNTTYTTGAILTSNGTAFVALANTGTAGTYANAAYIPVITTDAYGRVSAVTNTAVAIDTAAITSGTIADARLPTKGTAGTYANATHVPVITTDAYGRVTAVTNTAISFPVTSVAGVTGAVSNTQLLNGILTVDGSGSGLDADKLDGLESASFANAAFANTRFASSGGSITGDVSVTGNLTIIGQTIYANTTTALIADNIITLNAAINQASAPTVDAGFEIDRGSSANVSLLWNETSDKWTFTNDGTTYFNIADAGRLDSVFSLANGTAGVANTDYTTLTASAGTYGNASHVTVTTLTANGRVSAITNTAIAIDTAAITSGTLADARLPATGTAGTYANASHVPVITTDSKGRVTAVTNTAIVISAAAITSGTLAVAQGGTGVTTSTGTGSVVLNTSPVLTTPNIGTPSFATLTNATGLPIVGGTTGTLTIARGGTNQTTFTNGIIAFNGTSLATLANTGTAGTYANASHVPVITTDAYGRVSAVTNTAIAIDTAAITSGTLADARLPTKGTAGTYANATHVPVITTDAYGRVTAVTNTAISFPVTSVAGTTGAISNNQILSGLLTVDGVGSGLDADLLDGFSYTAFANATFANTRFSSSGGSITGDVTVTGNLTIVGQTVYANTTTALIADNIITLNAAIGQASAPTVNAGIEVDRGSSANVLLLWNETTDKWQFTNDGSTYFDVADAGRLDSVFSLANGTAGVANTDYTTISTTAGVYGNAAYLPVVTLTANGRVSSITNTAIALSAAAITSGTLAVTRGGTGVTISTGTGAVVLNTAPTLTSINVTNTTVSTSNITGAITVSGGIGVKGNVSANGIIFDDGTRQTTAASGGATLGDVLALSIALG